MNDPKVMMLRRRSIRYHGDISRLSPALFMFTRMLGDPDSMPRKTPLHPLSAIRSIASSSELLQRKYENQLNVYLLSDHHPANILERRKRNVERVVDEDYVLHIVARASSRALSR